MQETEFRFVQSFDIQLARQWFRIMPVGKFSKFGRFIEITDQTITDMVNNFRVVPPTKLPVNLEHQDTAGKVGDIGALRSVQGDGLYALIDWTKQGEQLLQEQRFQYFSPEIIFGPTDYEGKMVKNILYGLALTNHPYFGNDTAMFTESGGEFVDFGAPGAGPLSVSDLAEEFSMSENEVEKGVLAGLQAFFKQFAPAAPAAPATPPDAASISLEQFKELKDEIEQLKAEKIEAEKTALEAVRAQRVNKLAEQLGESMAPLADKLALIEDAALADDLAEQFKALAAQADTGALFSEMGATGGDPDAGLGDAERFNVAVQQKVAAGANLADAMTAVAKEHPDWIADVRAAGYSKKGK